MLRKSKRTVFQSGFAGAVSILPWLDDQWAAGCRNGAELWRRLTERGFRGSLRVISEWATRRRRAEKADAQNLQRIPSARTIARLMTIGRDVLTKAETVTVAAIEAGVPNLVDAREIIAEFHLIIRRKAEAGLAPWIERARASLVASFANGVVKDEAAVRAAITSPWSNGQTEGQITRLKLVRRQMYGRGKLDLLQARLIGAGQSELHQDCVRANIAGRMTLFVCTPSPGPLRHRVSIGVQIFASRMTMIAHNPPSR